MEVDGEAGIRLESQAAGRADAMRTPGIQPAIEAEACQIPASPLSGPIAVLARFVRITYPAHAVLLGMMSAAAAQAKLRDAARPPEEARRRVLRADTAGRSDAAGEWTISRVISKSVRRRAAYALWRPKLPADAPDIQPRAGEDRRLGKQIYPEQCSIGNRATRTAIQAQFSCLCHAAAWCTVTSVREAYGEGRRAGRCLNQSVVRGRPGARSAWRDGADESDGPHSPRPVDGINRRSAKCDVERRGRSPSSAVCRTEIGQARRTLRRFFLDGNRVSRAKCFTLCVFSQERHA